MDTAIVPTASAAIVESTPLDRNPAAVYIGSLTSAHSKRNMLRYLHQIAGMLTNGEQDALTLNWSAVHYQHTQTIRARLTEQYAPATVNVMLSALRGVLKETWRLGLMSAENYQRAVDLSNVKGSTLAAGRSLASGEIMALARACAEDVTAAGARDAAIIGILSTCGLRRAEVAALMFEDVETDSGKITIHSGKGRKARTVYATDGTHAALMDWLAVRGNMSGPLFTPVLKSGTIRTDKGLTAQAIYKMLAKRGTEAGVKDFSPHDFRRTFAGDMLDAGVDIVTVAGIMGHASVNTTGRYDRRPEETKRAAAKKLYFPYQKRG